MTPTTEPELSPLTEIERAVQARAKQIALDLGSDGARDALRSLIGEEVARWTDDFHRGQRPYDLSDPTTLTERAFRNLAGYGPLQPLLEDPDVWEIMVNAPHEVFVKRHFGPSGYHDEVFHDDDHVTRIITKLLDDASSAHRKLDPSEGLQDAQLDDGSRVHIAHADIARGGHLMVNIRKFVAVPYRDLDELVALDTLSAEAAEFLRACIRARLSIVFSGPPGSGKTTMLSCCAAELDPTLRVVIAEEVFEADLPVANTASLQTRPSRPDRAAIDLRRLVAAFLRMAPDIAIVGEVRDREALPLLLTLSSGVKGFTTIHAGSARQALSRLRFLCQLAETGSQLPMSALNALVSEAIDIVVHSRRTEHGVQVHEIIAVEGQAGGTDSAQFTATEIFTRNHLGELRPTGQLPSRAAGTLREHGFDPRTLARASERHGAQP